MTTEELEEIRERELTSGRSPAAIVLAGLIILVCIYALFEATLKAIGQVPLLAMPETWWIWIATLPGNVDPVVLASAGLAITLLGVLFIAHAFRRGRLAKHSMRCEDAVLVMDDQVLAAALARRARLEAAVGPGQVLVVVNREQIDVQVRPTSGTPLGPSMIVAGLEDELRINAVEPMPRIAVRVAESGVIGQ
ncbi:hypothetical protein ACFY5D_12540 [Paeniglutamicibacter sp. NPDC012692]|uniref:hypothetical protein n=1 Tax=Paeniglutamicibacter sp. NPDC012692 TaxID=3364388 RepID=UPI0036C2A6A5